MIQAPNPRAQAPSPQVGRAAKFFFDGVETPVSARVSAVDGENITLRQELPFLQLNGRVSDEQGRSAELTSVAVAVRDGTPSLVLEMRYQGRKARRDQTQPFTFHDPNWDTPFNSEALRGDAPATPLTPLGVPSPKRAWHVLLWQRIRMFIASFIR